MNGAAGWRVQHKREALTVQGEDARVDQTRSAVRIEKGSVPYLSR